MNLADKLEFKKDVLLSVGVKVEEALEGAERQAHEARGGKVALRSQAKNLLAIMATADEEVEKSIPDLETLKIVKAWMYKMIVATENAAKHLENVELQSHGEIIAQRKTHDILKKMVDDTDGRADEIRRAIAAGVAVVAEDGSLQAAPGGNGQRPAGARPGMSIKEQRLAEEAAAQAEAAKSEQPTEKKTTRRRKAARSKRPQA